MTSRSSSPSRSYKAAPEYGDAFPLTDIASVEQPPADWSEDEDYQLHRALEILRSTMESQQAALQ